MTQNIDLPPFIELPPIGKDAVRSLVRDMDARGYGCLPDYISPDHLAAMRAFVAKAVVKSQGEYVGFTGRSAVVGTTFDAISTSGNFRSLMKQVYEIGTGRPPPEVDFYQVLRRLTGRSGKRHALNFHYDSYVVTAFIPVEIPTTGKTGDLVMLPNTRRIRGTYFANLIDKVALDNKITQLMLKTLMSLHILPLVRIRPVPGSIYFFWGYRSVHTNEACDPDKVRATALYHYANPHAGASLGTMFRRPAAQ